MIRKLVTSTRKTALPGDHPALAENGAAPARILVIEDDADVAESLCLLLESYGYETLCAVDGVAAFERLKQGKLPDLILLDLMLPRMNGWEFREAQLADTRLREVPVLVLSAVGELAEPIEADQLLRKPFSPEKLIETIELYRRRT